MLRLDSNLGTLVPQPTAVLFDLDGTITDSGRQISNAVAAAIQDFGYGPMSPQELRAFAGPPLRQGFAEILGAPQNQLDDLVRTFRVHYRRYMLDAPVYPGIGELIESLHSAHVPLAVATSKVGSLAEQILHHANLAHYFIAICGAKDDESGSEKDRVVGLALSALRESGADISIPLMIGDRRHDVEGASRHGVPTLFAGWGFGSAGEEHGTLGVVYDPTTMRTVFAPSI